MDNDKVMDKALEVAARLAAGAPEAFDASFGKTDLGAATAISGTIGGAAIYRPFVGTLPSSALFTGDFTVTGTNLRIGESAGAAEVDRIVAEINAQWIEPWPLDAGSRHPDSRRRAKKVPDWVRSPGRGPLTGACDSTRWPICALNIRRCASWIGQRSTSARICSCARLSP